MMPSTCCVSQSNVHKIVKSQVADFPFFFLSVALGSTGSLLPTAFTISWACGSGWRRRCPTWKPQSLTCWKRTHQKSQKHTSHPDWNLCTSYWGKGSGEMAALLLQAPEPGAEGSSLFCSELSFQNGCDCRKFSESPRGFSGRLT